MRTFIVVLLIALFALPMFGQKVQTRNPANEISTYIYTLASGETYAASQKDTLPATDLSEAWAAYGTTLAIGAKSFVSMQYRFNDSVIVYMHYDYKYRDSSTWVNSFHDTLSSIEDDATNEMVYEKVLRDTDTDLLGCVDCVWRVVLQFTATAAKNGVTTPTYDAKLIWKP